MKRFTYYIPVALLVLYLLFTMAINVTGSVMISNAIIVCVLAAAHCYTMFLLSSSNSTKIYVPEDQQKLISDINRLKLQKDLMELQHHMGKFNPKEAPSAKQTFRF